MEDTDINDFIAESFGQEEHADAWLVFFVLAPPSAEPPRRKTRKTTVDSSPQKKILGDPFPAHTLVLCAGSRKLRKLYAARSRKDQIGHKPVLRIKLQEEEDKEFAISALRFIYTAKLEATSTVTELLLLRRQADFLQVPECVAACDTAILKCIIDSSKPEGSTEAVTGVTELYSARKLLPQQFLEQPAWVKVMDAYRQQLVLYSKKGSGEGAQAEGAASIGKPLGWAFGNAPGVLSDPGVRRQMAQLPAAALEALLGSSTFATDDESSVLLLLAVWCQAHPETPADATKRLCRQVRLSKLSKVYLHVILPTLTWFPISPVEYRFLCHYVSLSRAMRTQLAQTAVGKYDCTSPWYSASCRPAIGPGVTRSYEWFATRKDIVAELRAGANMRQVSCRFANSAARVIAHGFEWYPYIKLATGWDTSAAKRPATPGDSHGPESPTAVQSKRSAIPCLGCSLPAALQCSPPVVIVCPGPVTLSVCEGHPDDSREDAWSHSFFADFVELGKGKAGPVPLPLEVTPQGEGQGDSASQVDPIAGWTRYMRDGAVRGRLEWEAGDEIH